MTLRYDTTDPEEIVFADNVCMMLQQYYDDYYHAEYDEDDEDLPCNPMPSLSPKERFDFLIEDWLEIFYSCCPNPIGSEKEEVNRLMNNEFLNFIYNKMRNDWDIVNTPE